MTFSCHACGTVNSVLRLNGSPKEFQCTGCGSVYKIHVERIREPLRKGRMVKASEYVKVGS